VSEKERTRGDTVVYRPPNVSISQLGQVFSARGYDGYDMRSFKKKMEGTSSYPKKTRFFLKFTIGLKKN
jgi:hypothetical protein